MMNSKVRIESQNIGNRHYFVLIDSDDELLKKPRIARLLDRFISYFADFDNLRITDTISYISLQDFIKQLNNALVRANAPFIELSDEVKHFIEINQYAINEQKIAGSTIKSFDDRWKFEIGQFSEVLSREIARPLRSQQLQASFYLATMKCAANFSVPGAGKTAMMYGAYAYLSSENIRKIKRILVVAPINAFEAWRTEYIEIFKGKRDLKFLNLRENKYRDFRNIRLDWGISNIVIINYEALEGKLSILNELIGDETMIVFDEVHRVKGIGGRRAASALKLGKRAKYHYVLTGTPIPNSYKDVYNFLHLLYNNEYETFFGWDVSELDKPDISQINAKIQPFFWRTNKKELKVPDAEPDNLIVINPNEKQLELVKAIYANEPNVLALYIRLLQASTNPGLLLEKINYQDLGFLEDELNLTQLNALDDEEKELARLNVYNKLNVEKIPSEKFHAGIDLIEQLVSQGKKVIVWAMFVKTMQKIRKALKVRGISVNLVYGATPKNDRVELINEFRDQDVQVMISNPNTLGESISLHQSVHDAVYFEYNFNLTFMLQSRDRIHRLGLSEGQYTRYYYLMSEGDRAHESFIDKAVYKRLKEKEEIMLNAIDGELLIPEVTDDFLEDVKKIVSINIE